METLHRQEAASKASTSVSESKLEKMSTFGSFTSGSAENEGAVALSAGPTVDSFAFILLLRPNYNVTGSHFDYRGASGFGRR